MEQPGGSETRGLTGGEVLERTSTGRVNRVPFAVSRTIWQIVRANVLTLFNGIVAGSFLLLFLLDQWRDALFGLSAVGNSVIGIVQEYRAKRSLDQLAILHAAKTNVLRDGTKQKIPAECLVPDDLVVLSAGDQVTADLELTDGSYLEVDESFLTGESEPVEKGPGGQLLSGTLILGGSGLARVVKVGQDTFAYRLASEARRFSLVTSEIRKGLERVFTVVTWLLLPTALLLINAQVHHQGGWAETQETGQWTVATVAAVAGVLAMIPLGLLLLTSVAFAVGGLRLARRKVLVQELAAVEVLARVDVLCLDKTGTLSSGSIAFDALHDAGAEPAEGWKAALEWFGANAGSSSTAASIGAAFPVEDPLPEVSSVPFAAAQKWSSVTFGPLSGAAGTWILGAPNALLDGASPADGEAHRRATALASTGLRTLVLAHAPGVPASTAPGEAKLPGQMKPALLLTFHEKLRKEAPDTVDYFRRQGVTVKIISGDDPRTVAVLAGKVRVGAGRAYDARDLPADPVLLEEAMQHHDVFGSVTPSQKQYMIQAMKRCGHTVAMIGDGVNDILALKEADLGIAMDSASPATKAVARLVLLDGRFDRLPAIVAEGRRAIGNVERVSMVFLSKTMYSTLIALATAVMLLPFPFLPRQLSVIDGLTIGLPAFFLALQPSGRRYESGFLRRSLSFAVPAGLCVATSVVAVNVYAYSGGHNTAAVQTASSFTLSLLAAWILVTASRPLNVPKTAILAGMYGGLALLFTVSPATEFFRLSPPPPSLLAAAVLAAITGSLAIELVRYCQRGTGRPGR
ncbi:HAD-IC family P-type ATPase [Pseudarthrobacter sp. NPDC058362]|uniref:HAD-IC family P-type ATPase n=1 Tax=Pseudarthrobacter sp. NPDC058362 TaxID=3346458 RepID=UPI003653E39F